MPGEPTWSDHLNPFTYLGNAAGKVAADAWTAVMLAVWNTGLWLLRLVLTFEEAFLTPDLSEAGPGRVLYQTTLWVAGSLVVLMVMVQLCLAAARRDGRSLARVLIGTGQFVMVWGVWVVYAVAVLAACGGLNLALMRSLLHVDSWAGFEPWAGFSTQDITDGTIATVLGILGLLVILAAIGHALVMLTRAGAMMVLSATASIAAAGLVSDVGRTWFWKSLRWFHAAALTPVVMVLILGVGVQMTSGVATGFTDSLQDAIGTAVPGVLLILISCLAPLALFKLLAFVEPGTSSGAALRQGIATNGGIHGVFAGATGGGGGGGGGTSTSDAASRTDSNGKSAGESAGEDSTAQRFTQKASGLKGALGVAGQSVGTAVGVMSSVGAKGASIGADLTNQMGVGHNSYQPDFAGTRSKGSRSGSGSASAGGQRDGGPGPRDGDNPDINGAGAGTDQGPDPATADAADPATGGAAPSWTPPAPPRPAPGGRGAQPGPAGPGGEGTGGRGPAGGPGGAGPGGAGPGGGGPGGGSGGVGSAGGAEAGAAAVPVVPV